MNVLSISTDRKMFEQGSAVRARMVEYGTLFSELHIIIFTLASSGFKSEKISDNVWIYPTNSKNKLFCIFDAKKVFKKEVKEKDMKLDVVTTQDPFETGLAGWRIAHKLKIPLHVQIHTDFFSPYFNKSSFLNSIRVLIARFVLPRAKAIRVVSERIKNSLKKISPALLARATVLPIYTDIEKIKNTPITTDLHTKYPQFSFIILMASRLTHEKNIPLALKIFRDVITRFPKAGLIIVGDGPDKKYLQGLALAYHLDRNVVFEPWQSDLVSYYKSADLFLLTSFFEGYGLTLVEASASGCPIISSDVGIAQEVIHDGKTGFLCSVDALAQFSEKIIRIITSPELKTSMGTAIQTVVREKFAQSKSVYLARYKEMLENVTISP